MEPHEIPQRSQSLVNVIFSVDEGRSFCPPWYIISMLCKPTLNEPWRQNESADVATHWRDVVRHEPRSIVTMKRQGCISELPSVIMFDEVEASRGFANYSGTYNHWRVTNTKARNADEGFSWSVDPNESQLSNLCDFWLNIKHFRALIVPIAVWPWAWVPHPANLITIESPL